jgi:general bacterial porin, GBP family
MKKLLIASAALAMVAGTAQAQSSVTIYGVIDQSLVDTKTKSTTSTSSASTVASATNATSIIGIKGTEDLGGGLSAIFDFQGALLSTGSLGAANTSTTTADTMFDRQAYVGLSDRKLGTLKIGRMSDVVDSVEGYANFTQVFDSEKAEAAGIGGKNANTFRYDSPVIGGVAVSISNSTNGIKSTNATGHAGNENNQITTYGISYVNGPMTVGYAEGKANLGAYTSESKVTTAYAGYNLGFADVRAQYTTDKAFSTNTAFAQYKTKEVSAAIPVAALGSGVTAIVHYETAGVSSESGATANADYKQYGLVLTKALSKRTTVYAGYKNQDLDGTGSDVVTTAVGITHTF